MSDSLTPLLVREQGAHAPPRAAGSRSGCNLIGLQLYLPIKIISVLPSKLAIDCQELAYQTESALSWEMLYFP